MCFPWDVECEPVDDEIPWYGFPWEGKIYWLHEPTGGARPWTFRAEDDTVFLPQETYDWMTLARLRRVTEAAERAIGLRPNWRVGRRPTQGWPEAEVH
jgi:hypothetical protein